ncbi:MAG: selenide, water dikinase SelD, partial [Rhodospirillaceae bacterium]|nr:selenide, water dikinase SelD [Rhodospirillaceae bacterium]
EAGVPVAGGHSIDTLEPIYGLAVIGLVDIDKIKRNVGARPGDTLILAKGLGTGFMSSAMKAGTLSSAGYAEMLAATTRLNDIGMELAERDDIHAMTDVTGFGLLGHLSEVCQGSGVALPDGLPDWQDNMLYDPQTAGPLLVASDPGGADEILALFQARGFDAAAVIGVCSAGDPIITVG